MSPKLKAFLVISAKQAVNAVIVQIIPMIFDNGQFNVHSASGLEHIGMLAISAILAKESSVWLPKLLAWSQS